MFSRPRGPNGYENQLTDGAGSSSERPVRRRRSRRGMSHDSQGAFRVPQNQMGQPSQQQQQPTPLTDFDMAYFRCYAHVGVHEEMIKDRARTDTYRAAVMHHQSFIAGKVVVDVGCGTGILSIFCAQAGARRVYAIDASDIALQADEVVKANNLSNVITVLHGRVEDVEINEESMLGSVITARERWLKPGGLIMPSNATLYMAPITHRKRYSESIDFWRDVYGVDMSAMLPIAKQCAFEEPCVETITGENVLTWPHVVKHIDCYIISMQELESVTTRYKFKSMMRAPFHGFAFWFDVEFNGPGSSRTNYNSSSQLVDNHPVDGNLRKRRTNPSEALVLSTAPEHPPTHWQQTMIYFYDPIEVEEGQVIEGSVTLSQSKANPRFMNIHLEYATGGRSFVKESVMQ